MTSDRPCVEMKSEMGAPPTSSLYHHTARAKWFRGVFAFRFLFGMVLFTAATGFFLRMTPRFGALSWGLTEWAHVVVGWLAVPWTLGYLIHHMVKRWGSFKDVFRLLGLTLAGSLLVALISGVLLGEVPGAEGWPGLRSLHYAATFPILALLVLHPSRVLWGRLRLRATRLRGGGQGSVRPAPTQRQEDSRPPE